jgi:hypothetical protein
MSFFTAMLMAWLSQPTFIRTKWPGIWKGARDEFGGESKQLVEDVEEVNYVILASHLILQESLQSILHY